MRIALMPVDPAVCIYRLYKRSTCTEHGAHTSLYAVVDSDIMLATSMGGEPSRKRTISMSDPIIWSEAPCGKSAALTRPRRAWRALLCRGQRSITWAVSSSTRAPC